MNYSQILIAFSFFIIFSCQEKKAEDSGAADLNKQKEELLRQKEELLEEKAKMLKEAEKSSEKPKKEEKIAKPKFTDMRGNACLIGEWYFAQINDKDGYTNLRKSPSASSAIVAQINDGEEFQVLITNENWLRAVAPDGTEGYISANRVNPMYIGQ
jgi:hypothetical protein